MNKQDEKFIAQEIRSKYMQPEKDNRLESLHKMDAKVRKPAAIFAYAFGTVSTLIFGTGMCLAMDVLGEDMMTQGVAIGLVGMALMVINYPIYKKVLGDRIAKYGDEIIRLSEEILANQEL